MKEAILRKVHQSAEVKLKFFEENAENFERCITAVAQRFREGSHLWVMGNGGSACDAQHVAVEFMHPIIEKRKPLPATALTIDTATITAIGNDTDFSHVYVRQLESDRASRRHRARHLDFWLLGQRQSRAETGP